MSQPKYSQEFKDKAVRLSCQPGKSIRIVCAELGISRASLHHWRHEHRVQQPKDTRSQRGSGAEQAEFLSDSPNALARLSAAAWYRLPCHKSLIT
ncbi:MAG: Transposase [Chlorobi bacterium]|nr:Transposase [Chlorobiota bacterium]